MNEYFKDLPQWAKGVIAVSLIGGIVYIAYKISKKVEDIKETLEVKDTVRDAKSMYNKLKKEGKKLSDSNYSAYSSLANYIQKQLDGCEAITTEAMVVNSIIKLVKAPIDWYYLVSEFDVRDISYCGSFGQITEKYPLPELLKEQLDYLTTGKLLREHLKKIGITL